MLFQAVRISYLSKLNLIKFSCQDLSSILFHKRNFQTTIVKRKLTNSLVAELNKRFDRMIRIKFLENQYKVSVSLKCQISETQEREFNLNREYDEPILDTFNKLHANITKITEAKQKRSAKKQKVADEKSNVSPNSQLNDSLNNMSFKKYDSTNSAPPIKLFDLDNNEIALTTKNKDAWKENYKLKVFDQEYLVAINLPHIRKIVLPKLMIAQMPAIVKLELDTDLVEQSRLIDENSKIQWFHSRQDFNEPDVTDNSGAECSKPTKNKINQQAIKQLDMNSIEWILFDEGVNKKMCYLSESTENKLIKVVAIANDGKREGYAIEQVSSHKVSLRPDLNRFPMTQRHELTKQKLNGNEIRVMSYNILAGCYSETVVSKTQLYPYCDLEYLDFRYRRLILLHEIMNYNADIMFLQECEKNFFEDLEIALAKDYGMNFAVKGETKEGEAILFRSDRFKFVNSHRICLADEMKNNETFKSFLTDLQKEKEINNTMDARNTILQVVEVESLDKPNTHLLLANTHLFFHPKADFIRLLQAIICVKWLEHKKYSIESTSTPDKPEMNVHIVFGGDFNSDPAAFAFKYLFTQNIPMDDLDDVHKSILVNHEEKLTHSLNLATHVCLPFTNCIETFECVLDYVFFESGSFKLKKVIPLPPVEKIKENVAMPSQFIPSDHLPIIFEFSF